MEGFLASLPYALLILMCPLMMLFMHRGHGDAHHAAPKRGEARALAGASGVQEAVILVKGGYTPARIVADAGAPIRLTFLREESGACSERVVFKDFDTTADLPQGERVTIDLPATDPGEYRFECGMGMLRGTLIVR